MDGVAWQEMSRLTLELTETLRLGLGTSSANNDSEFLGGAIYRNFTIATPQVDLTPLAILITVIDGALTLDWDRGNLQGASSVEGPWENIIEGATGLPVQSPLMLTADQRQRFYRVVE
jgi:hypothetical protein